jgi:hypothetical protein
VLEYASCIAGQLQELKAQQVGNALMGYQV